VSRLKWIPPEKEVIMGGRRYVAPMKPRRGELRVEA
jgi:hypothetical protein